MSKRNVTIPEPPRVPGIPLTECALDAIAAVNPTGEGEHFIIRALLAQRLSNKEAKE